MPWYSGIILIILLFVGCGDKIQPEIGKKSFDNEDYFIIQAIFLEENNKKNAIKILENLYKKTGKKIYLIEIVRLNYNKKDYLNTIKVIDKFKKDLSNNDEIMKYKIDAYTKINKLNMALNLAKIVLKKDRNYENYEIMANIYIKKKEYKNAIKYLKSAYAISHNPEVLAQMGDLFFKYLKKPNEAISYYQTHIRLYGCNEIICNRLANIYRFLYDYDNLIEIYKKLFQETLNNNYGIKIVYLYLEIEKYNKAISFINKYSLDKKLLYLVYQTRLNKEHSYKDAYKIYRYTRNYHYFFLFSVYKFQNSKKGLLSLRNVIANLEFLIKKDRKPIYLNYLGYILIDYDIKPKKGIKLVKEALNSNPNSIEFLDSLAWGYYKLKKCEKAYQIISKINSDDEDIKKHKKIIRRCFDITKNNKKNRRKFKKR